MALLNAKSRRQSHLTALRSDPKLPQVAPGGGRRVPRVRASTSPPMPAAVLTGVPAGGVRAAGSVSLRVGAILVALVLGMALAADRVTPYRYEEIVTSRTETPPTSPDRRHWLGTDALGRDLLTRVVHGSRISLEVGLGGELIAVVLGMFMGCLAGWRGGWLDAACMRLVEVVLAFPVPLVVLAVVAAVPDAGSLPLIGRLPHPGIALISLLLGLVGWAPITRLVRAQIMAARGTAYTFCPTVSRPCWWQLPWELPAIFSRRPGCPSSA